MMIIALVVGLGGWRRALAGKVVLGRGWRFHGPPGVWKRMFRIFRLISKTW